MREEMRDKPTVRQLKTKKEHDALVVIFIFTYMVSYITRLNYGAIVSEIGSATGISRDLLSMAPTGSFITYGAGQLVSGVCGDRFSTKKLISLGLLVTTAMNLLLPQCTGPYQMLAVWCVNGFAQAFLWPPIVKTLVVKVPTEDYGEAMVKVLWGSSIGTILVYLVSPLLLSIWSWNAVFLASAACGAAMTAVWHARGPDVPPSPRQCRSESKTAVRAMFSPVMLCILVVIMFHGMLRDSVMTWMPSFISETYSLSNSAGILSGVALPVFGMICYRVTGWLHDRVFPNLLACAGAVFAVSTLAAGVLHLAPDAGAAVGIVMLAAIEGCMNGANLLLISILPKSFKQYGNISTVSGVLNSATYVGSALSTYGIAMVSVRFGWSASTLVWLILCTACTALCLINVPKWRAAHPGGSAGAADSHAN